MSQRQRRGVAAGALVLAAAAGGLWAAVRPAVGITHTVLIAGMRFEPEALSIKAGDSVVWINKDMFPHTATSERGRFDSQQISAGASWRYAFTTRGEFDYVCTLHPTMKAKVRVK